VAAVSVVPAVAAVAAREIVISANNLTGIFVLALQTKTIMCPVVV
jgi:hypothetical protein